MNALWLERISRYRNSRYRIETAFKIIELKIIRRSHLLQQHHRPVFTTTAGEPKTLTNVLLYEARAAKHFWTQFRVLLPEWAGFIKRKPHQADIANQLLDIGYHHITHKIRKILAEKRVPTALGLLHTAKRVNSAPLAYDLMEVFRADTVDAEVLRFLRLKKKPFTHLTQTETRRFLADINKRLQRRYYLRDFKQCHTYSYYMDLQVTKFIKAVNHFEEFEPLHLPTRHKSRCP